MIGAQLLPIRLLISHWRVRRFYLACHLVAAINPTDLDALDESVPFTKANPAATVALCRVTRCVVCADLGAMEESVRPTSPCYAPEYPEAPWDTFARRDSPLSLTLSGPVVYLVRGSSHAANVCPEGSSAEQSVCCPEGRPCFDADAAPDPKATVWA